MIKLLLQHRSPKQHPAVFRMMRRGLAMLFAVIMAAGLPAAALAEEAHPDTPSTSIRSVEDFLAFAEGCASDMYSRGKLFVLSADLDLSGVAFSPIPYFAGVFDGANHSISGLRLTADGSRQGLFRVVAGGAQVKNLTVRGSVTPGGTACSIGGIVGVNSGSLFDCSFEGTVSGIQDVGGIVGRNEAGSVLTRCISEADITGEHQIGGIAGSNDGTISACASRSRVNTVPVTPSESLADLSLRAEQFNGQFDLSQLSEDDFVNLSNIGGVAGASTGILDSCRNHGDVGYRSTGYNVGGIAGRSSGFVNDCRNYGEICGRRDTGGIVGQLVPFSDWDLSSGKLDALSQQVDILNGYLSGMALHTAYYSQEAMNSLSRLQDEAYGVTNALQNIMNASLSNDLSILDSIIVDPATGAVSFVSPDLSNVDPFTLTSSLTSLYAESQVLAELAKNTTGTLASDLYTVAGQISNVFNVLFSTVSSIGNVVPETEDLSRREAYTRNTGAIALCQNSGDVSGENNCGGILGTAAFEVEFDMEDRLNVSDYLTANARHNLFAAVRDCSSFSEVESRNACAGGIAGSMDIGVITGSVFSGAVSAGSGDYVGGLAGSSSGAILNSWSRCLLTGGKYIGGAAGFGTDIENTRIWVHFAHQNEYAGAVAGWAEGMLIGNLYAGTNPGGVDGISMYGQADAVSESDLLSLEGVPEAFGRITISYRKDGAILSSEEIPFGGSPMQIPQVSNRGEDYWSWELPDGPVFAPLTVDGAYHSPATTLSTAEDPPRFLAEGSFYDGQTLTVLPLDPSAMQDLSLFPELPGSIWAAYTVSVNDYSGDLLVRMMSPDDASLYLLAEGGSPQPCTVTRDGSYLLFHMPNGATVISSAPAAEEGVSGIVQQTGPYILILEAAVVVILLAALLILRRRDRKKRAAGAHVASDPVTGRAGPTESMPESPEGPADSGEDAQQGDVL